MPSHLIIQLSDIHLTTDGRLRPGVRPRDNLLAALALLDESRIRPDVFLLSGDLSDTGDPDCYADLAAMITEAAASAGASVIYLPGNHDARGPFRTHLLGEDAASGPINQVHWREGLRVIALDSSVPGEDLGVLAYETLDFLRASLASPAPEGSVLALHHPPITSPIEPMSRIRLIGAERLREVISGSDVRVILCGHNHHEAFGMLGSIPVWVSPATAYRADVTSVDVFRRLPGGALSRIDLSDCGLRVSVIPIPARPRARSSSRSA